jgi:hypothetical protein
MYVLSIMQLLSSPLLLPSPLLLSSPLLLPNTIKRQDSIFVACVGFHFLVLGLRADAIIDRGGRSIDKGDYSKRHVPCRVVTVSLITEKNSALVARVCLLLINCWTTIIDYTIAMTSS